MELNKNYSIIFALLLVANVQIIGNEISRGKISVVVVPGEEDSKEQEEEKREAKKESQQIAEKRCCATYKPEKEEQAEIISPPHTETPKVNWCEKIKIIFRFLE
jgi:hypothetical protein